MNVQKGHSLAQRPARFRLVRPLLFGVMLLLLPALTVLTAFGVAPGTATDDLARTTVQEAVALDDWKPAAPEAQRYVAEERVQSGDTVAAILERLGVHDPRAVDFLRTDAVGAKIYRQLVPGRTVQSETAPDGTLVALRYLSGPASMLEVVRTDGGFASRERAITEAPRLVYKTAAIDSSLFAATDAAGIPDAVAMQLVRIFSTDIDFHVDLRRGDRFSLVYEMLYGSGELVGPGRVLAAELVNAGHVYQAVLFRDDEGNDAYYSLDGANRAKAFLRSPVEFTRVSSRFGRRFHPIFKNWRNHTGVDFAAPEGTRILASADGRVDFAGWRGGYGNAIEIRHGGSITTLYGHLSRIAAGIHAGTRVTQGQAIGYVGHTGWATGPHLHYEFRIAGVYEDPLRVALPKAEPVPARLRAQFARVAAEARTTMELVSASTPARFE
ncbi:MAG TPA: M23 family metallopeptidase [Usitatibacter sp.]|nr:M23 family metallopeptidase [Usitatibacter sp.]